MITDPHINVYCQAHTGPESPTLQALREYTERAVHGAHMLSGVLVGRTLQFLLRAMQATHVLDVGTFTGYSALSMAEALPAQGKVITCDQSGAHLDIAASFFAQSEHGAKISLFEGLAVDCIASVDTPLDFAFVDADKKQLLHYIDLIYPKLKGGGFIVVDNALAIEVGDVLHSDNENVKAIHTFNEGILKDPRFMNLLLPIREGLNIMTKL